MYSQSTVPLSGYDRALLDRLINVPNGQIRSQRGRYPFSGKGGRKMNLS